MKKQCGTILVAAVALSALGAFDVRDPGVKDGAVAPEIAKEIDMRLRIGSHLYLRRDMSESEIFAAIGKMREIGMDIVRVYPYYANVSHGLGDTPNAKGWQNRIVDWMESMGF